MPAKAHPFHTREHDWHSRDYVDQWIDKDVTRDAERRPVLSTMMSFAPFAKTDAIRALDVGAGYGVVTAEVLRAFPKAQVTWQDYSRPMQERARENLIEDAGRLSFVVSDLASASWSKKLGGPFDLVVSGIAIHNLRDQPTIFRCYGAIRKLLAPGGCFLDYDYFRYAGGVDAHIAAMKACGFATVECKWQNEAAAIVRAR